MNKRIIQLEIEAEDKWCDGSCPFFVLSRTGIAGEYHPQCAIFGGTGEWRESKMKRSKECLKAERKS